MEEDKALQSRYQMILDYWKLQKEFYHPRDDEAYWDALISATNELYEKYYSDFLKQILLDFVADCERRFHSQHPAKSFYDPETDPLDVT